MARPFSEGPSSAQPVGVSKPALDMFRKLRHDSTVVFFLTYERANLTWVGFFIPRKPFAPGIGMHGSRDFFDR